MRVSRGDDIKVGPFELLNTEGRAVQELTNAFKQHKAQIAQIADGASKETLLVSAGKVDKAITQVSTANTALSVALGATDLGELTATTRSDSSSPM
jgi:hypothetical protein